MHNKTQTIYIIKATSAGFHAGKFSEISVNNLPVSVDLNHNSHYRGLHIVVINPNNGYIMFARAFDTYDTSEHLDHFVTNYVVPEWYIIVAACNDDCFESLSILSKMWFANLGS